MSEIVYAVHTRACTYLLDDEGFCRWVLSRSGAKSDDRCVGAQFVAALDLHSKGGLIGELRIGSSALFIRSENGRFVLIRTKAIEHVEIRGGEGDESDPYAMPEPEPVVLPDHLAVAGVFDGPSLAPEPLPPSARVILSDPRLEQARPPRRTEPPPPPIHSPRTEPLPGANESTQRISAPAPPAPVRSFPKPPPREPAYDARQSLPRSFPEPPPRVEPPAAVRSFPEPPPRIAAARKSNRGDPGQETQPLPPSGPVPAWPPMLAPPPPQAEMLPLGPARPHLPSAEELDAGDLEEVLEDDQIYSMEVTLTMPLFKGDPVAPHLWRR